MTPWEKLPKRIVIIGKRYSFVVVEQVDAEDSLGESDPCAQAILLKTAQGFEQGRDTALHEVTHAVDHQLDTELTEKQIQLIATGLLGALRNNPGFVRWLMAKE